MLILSGCATLKNNALHDLKDGMYQVRIENKNHDVYLDSEGDSIRINDISSKISSIFPLKTEAYLTLNQKLIKSSLDLDILTALFKIRTEVKNKIYTQLNANFNGNIYLGYRTDIYHIEYLKNPIGKFHRHINHFGFSGGFFLGLGNTAMTPTTTNNLITQEYDGILLQKGVAGIVAINNLTIGLSVGIDTLLDENKNVWLYQNKPWYGLMLGLNLN